MCVYGLRRADAEGQHPRTRQIQTIAVVSQFFRSASELQLQGFGRAAALYVASRALGRWPRYKWWCNWNLFMVSIVVVALLKLSR